MSITGGPDIVQNGLIFYVDAANPRSYPGSGTAWTDIMGTGNVGTLTNGPVFTSPNAGSISFDGTNDYATFSSVSLTSFPFTINVFAKTATSASARNFFGMGNTGNAQETILLQINALNQFTLILRTGDVTKQNAADGPTTTYNDGKWHLFTGVAQSYNTIYSYVDGNYLAPGLKNGETEYSFPSGLNRQTVGAAERTTLQGYMTASIASVQIYNRALSANELLQNYNATRSRFGL